MSDILRTLLKIDRSGRGSKQNSCMSVFWKVLPLTKTLSYADTPGKKATCQWVPSSIKLLIDIAVITRNMEEESQGQFQKKSFSKLSRFIKTKLCTVWRDSIEHCSIFFYYSIYQYENNNGGFDIIQNATKRNLQQSVLAKRGLNFWEGGLTNNILMMLLTTKGDPPSLFGFQQTYKQIFCFRSPTYKFSMISAKYPTQN